MPQSSGAHTKHQLASALSTLKSEQHSKRSDYNIQTYNGGEYAYGIAIYRCCIAKGKGSSGNVSSSHLTVNHRFVMVPTNLGSWTRATTLPVLLFVLFWVVQCASGGESLWVDKDQSIQSLSIVYIHTAHKYNCTCTRHTFYPSFVGERGL